MGKNFKRPVALFESRKKDNRHVHFDFKGEPVGSEFYNPKLHPEIK